MPNSTFNHVGVECPHCGYVHRDSWEWFRGGDEDAEIECENCEKPLFASLRVSHTFAAVAVERLIEKPR
jgi:DNA-directed RNA polymerase subunit RPC12/RpoP